MSLTVCYVSNQILTYQCFSRIVVRKHLLKRIQNNMDNLNVLLLVVSADVVTLAQFSFFLNHVDGLCVVIHIEPVTNVLTVAVYRKRFALQCIVDDQRDQFLRELIRAVVIATAGNVAREFVRIKICLGQHISACLTCRVRAVRGERSGLIEIVVSVIQGTVYLVGGDIEEFLILFKASVRQLPCCFCCVQHNQSTQYVGLYEYFRILDTAVYMALCCEMNHAVDIVLLEDFGNGFAVTDVCSYESVVRIILHILQILQITCIGQHVHIDNTDLLTVFAEHIMNVIGTDKSGAACYEISSHEISSIM